jgi:RNA polymerase sigma factor (sigma-70 family)
MKPADPNFLPTNWSQIAYASDPSDPRSKRALEELCKAYWYPVYAAIRRAGNGEHEAEDLTQSFFLTVLEKGTFSRADKAKGRFRTFVLSCLGNFLSNARAHDQAQKRDSRKLVSFESLEAAERYAAEGHDDLTPDKLFERTLAKEILRQAENELEADYSRDAEKKLFEILRPHLFAIEDDHSLASLAAELQLKQQTVKRHLRDMRKSYRALISARVGQTLSNPEDDGPDELGTLQNAL